MLLVRQNGRGGPVRVAFRPAPWNGPTGYEVLALDERRDLTRMAGGKSDACEATVNLPAPAVCLVRLWRDTKR